MSKQILVRRAQQNGPSNDLLRAQELSRNGDVVRVMIDGHLKPTEVKASECVDAAPVFGTHNAAPGAMPVEKAYSQNVNSLSYKLTK